MGDYLVPLNDIIQSHRKDRGFLFIMYRVSLGQLIKAGLTMSIDEICVERKRPEINLNELSRVMNHKRNVLNKNAC